MSLISVAVLLVLCLAANIPETSAAASTGARLCPMIAVICLAPCKYGTNDAGCTICSCPDCRSKPCNQTETCTQNDPTDLSAGYSCVPKTNLCCPKPVVPKKCPIQNYCQSCNLVCNMLCVNGLMCCPDWFGCHQCVKPVKC